MRLLKLLLEKMVGLRGYTLAKKGVKHPVTRKHFFDLYFSQINPQDFFYIQVGASDGKLADPLYPYVTKYKLAGVALEPLPSAFKKLQETYASYPRVRTLNLALASKSGRLPFYYPKGQNVLLSTLASLDRASLRKTLLMQVPENTVDSLIAETIVEALSFEDLASREHIRRVDLLQLDCEGYDWELLKTMDLVKWQPSLINFESALLSENDKKENREWLERHGYAWFEHGLDTCAYRL